jgi:hypothetical protein
MIIIVHGSILTPFSNNWAAFVGCNGGDPPAYLQFLRFLLLLPCSVLLTKNPQTRAEFLNQNLILNCTSLRHLAAIKCMPASISDKQGKSGRITDRQILNLDFSDKRYKNKSFFNIFHEILRKLTITTM